jgi:hypothetical protein
MELNPPGSEMETFLLGLAVTAANTVVGFGVNYARQAATARKNAYVLDRTCFGTLANWKVCLQPGQQPGLFVGKVGAEPGASWERVSKWYALLPGYFDAFLSLSLIPDKQQHDMLAATWLRSLLRPGIVLAGCALSL